MRMHNHLPVSDTVSLSTDVWFNHTAPYLTNTFATGRPGLGGTAFLAALVLALLSGFSDVRLALDKGSPVRRYFALSAVTQLTGFGVLALVAAAIALTVADGSGITPYGLPRAAQTWIQGFSVAFAVLTVAEIGAFGALMLRRTHISARRLAHPVAVSLTLALSGVLVEMP